MAAIVCPAPGTTKSLRFEEVSIAGLAFIANPVNAIEVLDSARGPVACRMRSKLDWIQVEFYDRRSMASDTTMLRVLPLYELERGNSPHVRGGFSDVAVATDPTNPNLLNHQRL
jgi:hypothetical protein